MAPGCRLWLADLAAQGEAMAAMALGAGILATDELERYHRLRRRDDARDYAASHMLLWHALGRPGGLAGKLQRAATGWLELPGGPGFSLSRSRGWAAVAVCAGGAVGVDIEALPGRAPELAILQHLAQSLGLDGTKAADRLAAFTVLEAWVKLRGGSLAETLDSPARQRELKRAVAPALAEGGLHRFGLPGVLVGHLWRETPGAPPELRIYAP